MMEPQPGPCYRGTVTFARLRGLLAVTRRRLVDRWHERRTGRRRRWDATVPPPGRSGEYVRLRGGASEAIPRVVAGPEYEFDPSPPPGAWRVSSYWAPREPNEPASPYAWRPAPSLPASLRRPR
jgi:hypothetical protein